MTPTPTELGMRLFALAQGRDIDGLMKELIDDHPAGWLALGDECFCHGRNEGAMPVAPDENDAWVEWAYAFDARARSMAVLHKRAGEAWRLLGLGGPEPDWRELELTSPQLRVAGSPQAGSIAHKGASLVGDTDGADETTEVGRRFLRGRNRLPCNR